KRIFEIGTHSNGAVVSINSLHRGRVTSRNGNSYIVNLEGRTCDCGHFQHFGIPCIHAIAFCREQGLDPYDYVSEFYSTEYWVSQYNINMAVPDFSDLPEVPEDIAPEIRRRAGRPRVRRVEVGGRRQRQVGLRVASGNDSENETR